MKDYREKQSKKTNSVIQLERATQTIPVLGNGGRKKTRKKYFKNNRHNNSANQNINIPLSFLPQMAQLEFRTSHPTERFQITGLVTLV